MSELRIEIIKMVDSAYVNSQKLDVNLTHNNMAIKMKVTGTVELGDEFNDHPFKKTVLNQMATTTTYIDGDYRIVPNFWQHPADIVIDDIAEYMYYFILDYHTSKNPKLTSLAKFYKKLPEKAVDDTYELWKYLTSASHTDPKVVNNGLGLAEIIMNKHKGSS